MRLAFMGTPDFAVPTLDALIAAGHEIAMVYTQPPRPAGRGKALLGSPIHRRAEQAGLPVRTPARLKDDEELALFTSLKLDAAIVAAYGLILPRPFLETPRLGCLNVHASLLPRWRGAAPVQRSILAGDEATGVCIMQMEQGLDTGPVYDRRETAIDRKTAGQLGAELAAMGGAMIVETLDRLPDAVPHPQPTEGVTYAHKIDKKEAELDFRRPAADVERQIRAFSPSPGAWFLFNGDRIRILRAELSDLSGEAGTVLDHGLTIACGTGSILPVEVQRAGRAAMTTGALLRGFAIPAGAQLQGSTR